MGKGWLRWMMAIMAIALILIGAVMFGFYAHQQGKNPLTRLEGRIERKWGKITGAPSETERLTAQIESTFLRLRGKVYEMPENDYANGGAMTVWGEDLLILDHAGRIYLFEDGRGLEPIPILPPENGLADYKAIAETPPYDSYTHVFGHYRFNDITYVEAEDLKGLALSYTFFDKVRTCYGTRVAWLPLSGDIRAADVRAAPEDWHVIFETYPCQKLNPDGQAIHAIAAGGRMVFQAPSTLYLGSGDYGLDGMNTYNAGIQSDDNAYGKVMAIDLRSKASRIVSKGHRNLQGLAIDKQGRLWTTEHAVRGGDELNLIVEGEDYGWPSQTLGTLYSGLPAPVRGEYGQHDLYRQPVHAWLPSAGVSSLTVIDGIDPSWDGDLLAGSLSSPEFGQSLWHIRIAGERAVFVERISLERRIRYLTQWQGKIAVWLDSNELVIFTLERRPDPLQRLRQRLPEKFDDALAKRIGNTLDSCNECHSFEENVHGSGPSLNGVLGRRIAGTSFEDYSAALSGQGGKWDRETLKLFLDNPQAFAPGTAMPDPGLSGQEDMISGLIWALENIDTRAEKHMTYN